jgi:hypothetical protein
VNAILGLAALVEKMSKPLNESFVKLCGDFNATPKIRLDDDAKREIVDAVDTAGWDKVGVDFFEFLGNIPKKIFEE